MMFGKKDHQEKQASSEREDAYGAKDLPLRVFAFPQEFRGREVVFPQKKQEDLEVLPPLVIPIPVPAETDVVTPLPQKKRRFFGMGMICLCVFLCALGVGIWWYVVVRAPQALPVPQPLQGEEPPAPPQEPKEPYPGTDTDTDGLTNIEELLYGTDFRSPDTDRDTFLDGNEVFHRYDPNGLAPSTLLDTRAVRVLERGDIPFTVYYPASWTVSPASANARILFRSADQASVEITYYEKDVLTKLAEWMEREGIQVRGGEETMTKEGYPAQITPDGRTAYIDIGVWVLVATYDLGESLSIEFLQTFKMMMNSVALPRLP